MCVIFNCNFLDARKLIIIIIEKVDCIFPLHAVPHYKGISNLHTGNALVCFIIREISLKRALRVRTYVRTHVAIPPAHYDE